MTRSLFVSLKRISCLYWRRHTEKAHLLKMVIERKDPRDAHALHDSSACTIRKRPVLVMVKTLKNDPRRTFNLFRNVHDRENAACLELIDGVFKCESPDVSHVQE